MTSKDDLPEVTILCEDIDQERFIREYLICRGWSDRKIKNFGNVKGRIQNNNASVLKHYPKLVNSYRRRKYRNIAIVVMIDDDTETLHKRMRSLHTSLDETAGNLNQDPRLEGEKIAIFVPARNINTWFYYINHLGQDCDEICDEITDRKKSMSIKERIDLAKSSAKILAEEICPHGVDRIGLPSLRYACTELQRLYL